LGPDAREKVAPEVLLSYALRGGRGGGGWVRTLLASGLQREHKGETRISRVSVATISHSLFCEQEHAGRKRTEEIAAQ